MILVEFGSMFLNRIQKFLAEGVEAIVSQTEVQRCLRASLINYGAGDPPDRSLVSYHNILGVLYDRWLDGGL